MIRRYGPGAVATGRLLSTNLISQPGRYRSRFRNKVTSHILACLMMHKVFFGLFHQRPSTTDKQGIITR
jgi:hypothetical protein